MVKTVRVIADRGRDFYPLADHVIRNLTNSGVFSVSIFISITA